MTSTWVYRFDQIDEAQEAVGGDWDDVRGLLGGKGANLGEMTRLGIPVPTGFTVTAAACNAYIASAGSFPAGLWEQIEAALSAMESQTGKRFGDPSNPLLVACRSGAKFSMPGMMDTVLDIGLNDEVVEGMTRSTGNAHFALDSYRRLIQMFGSVVLGVADEYFERVLATERERIGVAEDSDLTVESLESVIDQFKAVVARRASISFPSDPYEQLRMAVRAVFDSWDGKRAQDYRRAAGISNDLGTAVNVVSMVFGNFGPDSATGVAMSRNATTGEAKLEGDFLVNAQGEDVVAGIRPTRPIHELADVMPEISAQFAEIARSLEGHYGDMQDMEFTVERGKLWLLQTRDGKRTAQAAVRIAVELANEGAIDREEAVRRITPEHIEALLHPRFVDEAKARADLLGTGLNVSPGAAVGHIALDPDLAERWATEGRRVILVRPETKPDDVHGMLVAAGILTSSGGRTSHAALVARQFGRPAVVGAAGVAIDLSKRTIAVKNRLLLEGDVISIDGTTGEILAGEVETMAPDIDDPWLSTLLGWADQIRTMSVRANADEVEDARRARRFGAEGIGLCRTEHMFFDPERLPVVQRMITAPTEAERNEAIAELLPFQRKDFADLFRAMDGQPVIIRLLDPPLHEFLPDRDELNRQITDLQIRLRSAPDLEAMEELLRELAQTRAMLEQVDSRRESNPMLGLRGVRLGLQYPEITRMQARAIFEAAAEVAADGMTAIPEVMVPLVSHEAELANQRALIEVEAAAVMAEVDVRIPVRIGTMIEVPRAALVADEIAAHADFVSFGTNDLTQTTFGMSRDDAETGFLVDYLSRGVLSDNPFSTLDEKGVGALIEIAIAKARSVAPDLDAGICGEHGGDPASIELCNGLDLSYVSCSPFRVPIARLAAAHAELGLP
ncbi:MAG: pyruvate, phosphate dikinase [Acidimicrobiales bacterium]